jgi:hypothetical protein
VRKFAENAGESAGTIVVDMLAKSPYHPTDDDESERRAGSLRQQEVWLIIPHAVQSEIRLVDGDPDEVSMFLSPAPYSVTHSLSSE